MTDIFFIVGPTAAGKSELAADVAANVGGEIVNADAFQIYKGFDVLTGKPAATTLAKAPHHLLSAVSPVEPMSAHRFASFASAAIDEICGRGRLPIVVGGTGLYLKALTHGLESVPAADPRLREKWNGLSLEELQQRLVAIDPETARRIDLKNRRRVVRALEICLLSGKRASEQLGSWRSVTERSGSTRMSSSAGGVVVVRDRDDLYERINRRVATMLEQGAIEEVRNAEALSATASKMIGFADIQQHLGGRLSLEDCLATIQQATRRYAKRQLTWFRHQTNFEVLNLSLLRHTDAVEWVSRRAARCACKE